MEQIPLKEALICINCNTICRMPQHACPHCAGEHMVAIGAWLNPRPAPKRLKAQLSRDGFYLEDDEAGQRAQAIIDACLGKAFRDGRLVVRP
jgi:hypothetical protein